MTNKIRRGGRLPIILAIVAAIWCSSSAFGAQSPQQQTFASPWKAVRALVAAAKADDATKLLALFGPDGKSLVYSGDPAEDKTNRQLFVEKFERVHRLIKEQDGSVVLYLGPENWPFPIPLVQQNGSWHFDTAAGKQEILFRRIGRNELSAIETCHELVAAQKEHYAGAHPGEAGAYAAHFVATKGEHNGLYHQTENGKNPEIGPLLAQAGEGHTPFHGYFFRILTRQGHDAPGGAKDYIIDGKMTGGFAFLAYPAKYRSTGVMTFLVGQDGTVYEKDLGPKTDHVAASIKEFNPASGWKNVEEGKEEKLEQSQQ